MDDVGVSVQPNAVYEWAPNESDVRPRAIQLFRMLGELYGTRYCVSGGRFRADSGKNFHWHNVANILQELAHPICTPPQIDVLERVRGIGESTIRALHTIRECGFLDFIVDFCNEISDLIEHADVAMLTPDVRTRIAEFGVLRVEIQKLDAATLATRVRLAQERRRDVEQYRGRTAVSADVRARTSIRVGTRVTVDEFRARFPERDETCVVCLDVFNSAADDMYLLNCTHVFHDACIDGWLKARKDMHVAPACPLCRARIQ